MQQREDSRRVIIDLDAIFDFIFEKEDRNVDTSIEETHSVDENNAPVLVSTTIRENKSSDHSQHEAVKYEFVRNLLSLFDDVDFDEEKEEPVISTLSQEIAWNTLFQYGFIKKI